MRMMFAAAVFAGSFSISFAEAQAPAQQTPACAAMDANLKDGFEAWTSKADLAAVGAAGELAKAELKVGAAMKASLLPTPKVDYPVRPEKPGGSVSHGGLLAFTVSEPGMYGVALSAPAWVEVLKDGRTIAPAAFGHGPACTTIRKIVDFQLKAGAHVLEVAANADATIDVLVLRRK